MKLEEKDMDIYQYFTADELKYFYIRNNLYIERLEEDDKIILKEKIKNKEESLDETGKKLIEKTYRKVINESENDDGKKHITSFGPNSVNFFAQSDAIVIGFRYDEFNLNGLEDEEWKDNHLNQLENLNEVVKEMIDGCEEDIKEKIRILIYTQFSVVKRS